MNMLRPLPKVKYGGHLHRIANKPPSGKGPRVRLSPNHDAVRLGQSLFQKRVVHPHHSPRALISGMNARKIGRVVTKGKWKGMPLFTLTLEERKTCPRSCGEWITCYGNQMNWARRHVAGLALEAKLVGELADLAARHPRGFAVRLHILGDFYSAAYVGLWCMAMEELPSLHLFGFTAHGRDSEIGAAVMGINRAWPERCRIRFSGTAGDGFGSRVIDKPGDTPKEDSGGVICPVQTGKTDCCGTCGLCWTMDRTVYFVRH